MAKQTRKTQKQHMPIEDFSTAAFADVLEKAQEYESILTSNDIPVQLQETDDGEIAVNVPESYFDEARAILDASLENDDQFSEYYEYMNRSEDDFGVHDFDDFTGHYYE